MPLWGKLDNATGNQKPKFANTASTMGVSATERANTSGDGKKIAHTGWVKQTIGTGPLASITIVSGGAGINANGFITLTGGGGSGANAAYYIANSQNTLQPYSANSAWNTISRIVVLVPGSGYNTAPTATITGANTTAPSLTAVVGGRAGRRHYETLVATGSITGDDSADNNWFPGT